MRWDLFFCIFFLRNILFVGVNIFVIVDEVSLRLGGGFVWVMCVGLRFKVV